MRVKVCGITQYDQLQAMFAAGADFAGMVFYPRSPRYALRHMTTSQIRKENNVNKVGVFVNAAVDELLQMVDECRLHMVQLHGDESPRYCEKIADHVSVIKAFRFSETDNIAWRLQEYYDVCDLYMVDTEGVGYGGTDKKFDRERMKGVSPGKPYLLGGRIGPEDAASLNSFAAAPESKALFAIDINTQFEVLPGIKNMPEIKRFIQNVKTTT